MIHYFKSFDVIEIDKFGINQYGINKLEFDKIGLHVKKQKTIIIKRFSLLLKESIQIKLQTPRQPDMLVLYSGNCIKGNLINSITLIDNSERCVL